MKGFFEAARALEIGGSDFVTVTLISGRGHIPQDPGAKMLVTRDGLQFGTVGGGKVEARAILHAKTLLEERKEHPEAHVWNLQKDIGMTCGGEVTYLFEPHLQHAWRVRVFGAGHVAQSLVRVLRDLPVSLTCVDGRAEWIERLPRDQSNLEVFHAPQPGEWVTANEIEKSDFFVVITQGHATDVPVLEAIFRKHPLPRYIGVIGSETKGIKIKSELRERGVAEESIACLRIPIGLDIGTNHPGEIAISIAAELLQVRDRKE